MKELSLYILDIAMNSVRAGADVIAITLDEGDETLDFTIRDNGCGMTAEQVAHLSDPFFTTRKTRKVGLGVPFLRMLAEMTGGCVRVESVPESESADHGTVVFARFFKNHIDFVPLGDMPATLVTLVQGSPEVDFEFCHTFPGGEVRLSMKEVRSYLGDDIPASSPEVLAFIGEYVRDAYSEYGHSI